MRSTTRAVLDHHLEHLRMSGDVLEIGGFTRNKSAIDAFPAPRYRYRDCDLMVGDIPETIVADITDCRDQIPDESFDVVLSCDVFEHINRPWLAAAEIARILRPGGIVLTRTVWSWRNHPCPIDYWRFSPECLEFLFAPLECLEKGYDLSERRKDYSGFWADGGDSVPVDTFGGFRENWAVYTLHRKGSGPAVTPFRDTKHPLAQHLRRDTQGTVTNPALLGAPSLDPLDLGARMDQLAKQLDLLHNQISRMNGNVGHRTATTQRARAALAEGRTAIASRAPRAARAYRGVRRELRNLAR